MPGASGGDRESDTHSRAANIHIDIAGVVERDVFLCVAAADRESLDDNLRWATRSEFPGRQLEPADVIHRGVVEISVPQLETRPADRPKLLADDVDFAISVRVPESDDATRRERLFWRRARTAPRNHVNIPVAVDEDMAAFADASVVNDERAEARGQGQTAIVGITRRQAAAFAAVGGDGFVGAGCWPLSITELAAPRHAITSASIKRFIGLLSIPEEFYSLSSGGFKIRTRPTYPTADC